jgi:hypothetical protein
LLPIGKTSKIISSPSLFEEIERKIPGLKLERIHKKTGKNLIYQGHLNGTSVAVKMLNSNASQWIHKFTHEIDTYIEFSNTTAPVRVPRLIYTDRKLSMIVLEWIDGVPLATERYPVDSIPNNILNSLIIDIQRIENWIPTRSQGPEIVKSQYLTRATKYHERKLLTDLDMNWVRHQLTEMEPTTSFCHGDLLLSNCLKAESGFAFVDWEYAGTCLPGYDLALIWILLCRDPNARNQVLQSALNQAGDASQTFALNVALLLARELKIHMELPESDSRHQIASQIKRDLELVRDRFF